MSFIMFLFFPGRGNEIWQPIQICCLTSIVLDITLPFKWETHRMLIEVHDVLTLNHPRYHRVCEIEICRKPYRIYHSTYKGFLQPILGAREQLQFHGGQKTYQRSGRHCICELDGRNISRHDISAFNEKDHSFMQIFPCRSCRFWREKRKEMLYCWCLTS